MRWFRSKSLAAAAVAAISFLFVAPANAAKVRVSAAGAAPGAAAYVIWGGLAALVTKESSTVAMNNLTTRGAVEDLRLIQNGRAEFGLGVATLVNLALKGKKMFKKPHGKLRGVGPATVTMFHIGVLKNSGIKKVGDLAGKRLSFARKGGNTFVMTKKLVKFAGIKVREHYLNWNVAADAIKDNRLDAFTIPNPVPSPAFLRLATAAPITLLPLEGKVLKKMLGSNPAYFKISIPAGSYNGVDKDVPTVGYIAWTVTSSDVPNDVVYEVTRLNYSKKGRAFLPKVHKGWKLGFQVAPALDKMAAIKLKLHPGAARYWKEKGYTIPAAIR